MLVSLLHEAGKTGIRQFEFPLHTQDVIRFDIRVPSGRVSYD